MTPQEYVETVLPRMEGWCSPQKANRLIAAVAEQKPRLFVEIGVFAGRSLFAAALALPSGGVAVGIDPWCVADSVKGFSGDNQAWWSKCDHDSIYKQCQFTQSLLDLCDRCYLIRATSPQALALVRCLAPIDILHIDGNHSEECSCFDVENYQPLVKPGGIIFFDDIDWNETKKAQRLLAERTDTLEPVGTCGVFRQRTLP